MRVKNLIAYMEKYCKDYTLKDDGITTINDKRYTTVGLFNEKDELVEYFLIDRK